MDLESDTLREVSQKEKNKHRMISLICDINKTDSNEHTHRHRQQRRGL